MLRIFSDLEQVVYQLRYSKGYLFLDRSGRLLRELISRDKQWIVSERANPQVVTVASSLNDAIVNFGATSIDISLRRDVGQDAIGQSQVDTMFEQIDLLNSQLIDRLDLEEFVRVGFRCVFSIPQPNIETARNRLDEMNLWRVNPKFSERLENGILDQKFTIEFVLGTVQYRLQVGANDRPTRVRIGNTVQPIRMSEVPRSQRDSLSKKEYREISAQKGARDEIERWSSPSYIALDVDAFMPDPIVEDTTAEFAKTSLASILNLANDVQNGFK